MTDRRTRPRAKPHNLEWPISPEQLQNVDSMLEELYDDSRNGTLTIDAEQVVAGTLTLPLIIGGTEPTSSLTLQATSSIFDESAANVIIKVGGTGRLIVEDTDAVKGFSLDPNAQDTVMEVFARNGTSSGYVRAHGIESRPAGYFGVQGRAVFQSPADGKFLLSRNAGANFDSLMFGGTSSSFAAIEPSGTTLQIRLADSSGDAPLTASRIRVGDGSAGTPSMSFLSHTDMGFYTTSSVLGVTVGGTLHFYIPTTGHLRINSNNTQDIGEAGGSARTVYTGILALIDGVTAPSTVAGQAFVYVDTSDGDAKIKFGDGTVKVIADDTLTDFGTYTPSLTGVANVAASTAYQAQYQRQGSTVTVSGKVDIDPTAAGVTTQLGISLPVASNFGALEDCAGVAAAPAFFGECAGIYADTTNDRAQLDYVSGDISNHSFYWTFTYQVI